MPTRSAPPPPGARAPSPPRGTIRARRGRETIASREEVILCLAIAREGIGLELARPVRLGCLRVTALATTFPGMRFPADVSGGVHRFRHRRGQLQRVEIELSSRSLVRWATPRLRGIVSEGAPDLWVAVASAKATICVSALDDRDREGSLPAPAVAFDIHAMADGDDLVLVVGNARGVNLPAPAAGIAIACVAAMIGRAAERSGALFTFRRLAAALSMALLPEAGARIPGAHGVCCAVLAAEQDTWFLQAARDMLSAPPTDEAIRAYEVARLLRDADDLLVAGDPARARSACLEALGLAPRHREITARLVDIDVRTTGHAEGALAMLEEMWGGAEPGIVRGELLRETGDFAGALASLERAAAAEPSPALAARAYVLAAAWTQDPEHAAQWLDRAIARSPRAVSARWARVHARLALGRVDEALGDVEHLEALAGTTSEKYAVWLRAGRDWQARGLTLRAQALFGRALRFAPEEPEALTGLAEALLSEGASTRGVALLTKALEIARARGTSTSAIVFELARALAERLADLPTAIAHISSICGDAPAPEAAVAKGLEARWRARLGDTVGASLAFAGLREAAASLASIPVVSGSTERPAKRGLALPHDRIGQVVDLLIEAADLELAHRLDPLAAQRHLAVALRLRPYDDRARRAFREVGDHVLRATRGIQGERNLAMTVGAEPSEADATDATENHPDDPPDRPRAPIRSLDWLDLETSNESADIQRAARVDELTRRLQSDPGNDGVADELASLLEQLGRGHELLALLSARLEDATPERREVLSVQVRTTLDRLAVAAEKAGRVEEAALLRDWRGGLT
jgi:cellulose synthase operon protein C